TSVAGRSGAVRLRHPRLKGSWISTLKGSDILKVQTHWPEPPATPKPRTQEEMCSAGAFRILLAHKNQASRLLLLQNHQKARSIVTIHRTGKTGYHPAH